jgi:hypothetical protein
MTSEASTNGTALPDPPAEVAELAAACVVYVERATKVLLDWTPETLPLLDHYVRSMRKELGTKDEVLALVAAPVGAYLGEVARRSVPLNWFAPPGEYRRWRIELEDVFLSLNPIGAAVEALLLQEAEGWGAELRMRPEDEPIAKMALANLPEVEEDEYYAPSSRLEVLSIVADALWAHDVAAETTRKYAAADYGPVRAEAIGDALAREEGDGG